MTGASVTMLNGSPYPSADARVSGDLVIRMPTVALADIGKAWLLDRAGPGRDRRDLPRPSSLCLVRSDAPAGLRKAVYACARYFRREFRYDFVQYSDRDEEPNARAFLWYSWYESFRNRTPVWGAGCFRWRTYTDHEPQWAMQWIWLHPYARNQGLLTAAWPYFRDRFGDFHVEGPFSPAMRAFLNKVGWFRT